MSLPVIIIGPALDTFATDTNAKVVGSAHNVIVCFGEAQVLQKGTR